MQSKVVTKTEALKLVQSCKLALVSGSFDLLHPGHLYLFKKAKELAPDARLLVLVMDDANIRRRKGPDRPVNTLRLRIKQLQETQDVDYILAWTEKWEEIAEFVATLKPAYLVAAVGDPGVESKQRVVETAGGKFITISKLPGHSTTNLIRFAS